MSTSIARPIRIAFCITELDHGGAERCLTELVTRLDRARFDPLVYCLGPRPRGNTTSLAEVIEQAGIEVVCLEARRWIQLPRLVRSLRRHLAQRPVEILQTFLFHANVIGALAGHRAGVPHIVSGIRVAERQQAWHLRLARWTDPWVERHVCVSQAVQDFSLREGRLPRNKLLVIPNGVTVERFAAARPAARESLGVPPARRLISYVGRLDEQKGVLWLLHQMPRIFAALPEHDWLIVGSGPMRGQLEREARQLGVLARLHFAGFRHDVPEILAGTDLLVLPSRWEGMPNALLEAMAAGKPVVASDVEGVGELLGPDAGPQVASVGNAELFCSKVVAICSDPSLAARLGKQNHQRAERNFTLTAMVSSYERLYQSLVDAPA